MKRIFTLSIIIALCMPLLGNPVDETTAKQLAQNFWKANNIIGVKGEKKFKKRMNDARFVNVAPQCGYSDFYIFNNEDGKGFVIIAADDCVTPILAYSYDNSFVTENLPPNLKEWLDGYAEQIQNAIEMKAEATSEIRTNWERLQQGKNLTIQSVRRVYPLITTTWNQEPLYNAMCPYSLYYDKQTVTGCVATAMAQIMKYWEYPLQGIGEHTYTHTAYTDPFGRYHDAMGTLYANFGNTTYNWSNMPISLSYSSSQSQIDAIATIMYHCGVSVNMDYGVSDVGGSGAQILSFDGTNYFEYCSENALKTFFDYKNTLHGELKDNYNDSQWTSMLKNDLDNARPILYAGFGNGGHAFVCDGYDNSNYFHFNWGWGGYGQGSNNDAYYYINNLNPLNNNFSNNQQALIGIEPNNPTYPFNLIYYSNPVISDDEYSFFDDMSVYAEVLNNGSGAFHGYIGAGVYYELDSGSNEYYFIDIMDEIDCTSQPLPGGYYSYHTYSCAGGPPYIPGSYLVVMQYSMDDYFWNIIDPGNYNYAGFDIVSSYQINARSYFSILTGDGTCLYQNTSTTVNIDVINNGSSTFYGQFKVGLYDANGNLMQNIDIYDCTNGLQPNYHYTNGINFSGLVTVEPGTYLMLLTYKGSTASSWYYAGASYYQNPVWVYVAPDPLYADSYEPNNTQNLAYSFTPSFSNNSATVNTTGSNFHNSSDVDYYKINLSSGYDYTLTPRLHDSYNSGNGNTYSADAKFAYSTDGVNWSQFYDDVMTGNFQVSNGGIVYFDVIPYYEGDIGTYLLSIGITRTQISNTYTVSVSANPNNGGSVSGGGTYNQGQSCTVHATANSGYSFINWTENGTQVSSNANYTFTVNNNRNLVANFQAQQPQQYTIHVDANPTNGGNVTGSGTYNQGSSCTVHATANSGYTFTNWTENGSQVSTNADYSFTVNNNRNLVANFAQNTFTIQASAGANGIITPSGTITVSQGDNQSFAMIPDTGYEVQDVYIDGNSVGSLSSYTFTNVNANHQIYVTFKQFDGVGENDDVAISVYPNPTSGEFYVECENMRHIRITNALGQVVYNADVKNNQININLSNMVKGIYILHIDKNDKMLIKKVILK